MTSPRRLFPLLTTATLLAAALGTLLPCNAQSLDAKPLNVKPVEGIVVLRNGNLLQGKVQRRGEDYLVHLPNGSLQVRGGQVEMVCQNMEEAYQRRRGNRGGTSADSHLELAAWCLRHDLLSNAENEIQNARTLDASHPRLGRLQRQLEQAAQIAERRYEQHTKVEEVPTTPPLDAAELDKAPDWARALFVRQIQPLVVHSCATGGCHQSTTPSDFRLNRLAVEGAGHPDATLRNLAETLKQIDWEAVENSDLLVRARKAHGSKNASTPLSARKLQVLRGWVEQLAEAHRKDTELRTVPHLAEVAPPLELIPPQQTVAKLDGKIHAVSYEAADPFDPAAFNRQRPMTSESSMEESAVPHILAPTHPVPIPLPPTE